MDLVDCRGCGEPVIARSSRCWRCGHPVTLSLRPEPGGHTLSGLGQGVVITAVFSIALFGMIVLDQRQQAVEGHAAASAAAVAAAEREREDAEQRADREALLASRETPTPIPAPEAGGPGTYTVQAGDSLFSVAGSLGLHPDELVFWNKETYPTLQSTPALKAGWVLQTTGPALPTPEPRPTPRPRAPPTPEPQTAGPGNPALPAFGPESFPASSAVTVSYYAVSGVTPREIHASIQANGPWSDWLGRNAQAHVQVQPSFNFTFRGDQFGGCGVVPTGSAFVTMAYNVLLPAWTPPAGVPQRTVDWWIETIHETVAHEAHHIALYESVRPAMNNAVATGTCVSIEADLVALTREAGRLNCEFDG